MSRRCCCRWKGVGCLGEVTISHGAHTNHVTARNIFFLPQKIKTEQPAEKKNSTNRTPRAHS